MANSRIKDETGKRYGRLTVLQKAPIRKHKEVQWECLCDCGNKTIVLGNNLRRGHSTSCGCYAKERTSGEANRNFKGGHYRDRLYHVWMSMKQRCYNPNNGKYKHYGERGITVCHEWMEYEAFRTWAYANGYDEKAEYGESTIDRINVDGNYEPENCRFVDLFVQNKNRRPFKSRRRSKE